MSKRVLFNDGWEFAKTSIGGEYSDLLDFHKVELPHDWLIYDTHNLYETSRGWYRKHFKYEDNGGVTSIRFEGVYMDSAVYVNGRLVGEWKYGYSTFEFDITDFLKEGDNLILVKVDYQSPNTRWYSGAGIYRNVWLISRPKNHIVSDGIYISASASGDIDVSVETLRPEKDRVDGLSLNVSILDMGGLTPNADSAKAQTDKNFTSQTPKSPKLVASREYPLCAADRSAIADTVRRENMNYGINEFHFKVDDVTLWDVDAPYLYLCRVELKKDGEIIDVESQRFGFRDILFTTDKGFFLNGRHLKLHGACEHHDFGALGSVSNRAATFRKARMLKSMGINALRTSHNMPSVEWMEVADQVGLLVMSEGFDMWERPKNEFDYARFFKDWVRHDVSSWIRRDRNHPSIIGWSLGNEIYDAHAGERGQEIISMLKNLVRIHDPRENGYVTHGSNYLEWENAQKCTDIVKLAGYNYGERLYDRQHEKHPDWMIYGSETSSVVQSRGIYHFPYEQAVLVDDDEQCSSLGNSTMGWAAKSSEMAIIPDRDRDFCAGQFIWTGFDYIGEPTPYSTKNSYFGQIDTAGFVKDSYYIYKAEWTDYKKDPFVHILPYWDFSEGQEIDVRVISNAPRVELFFDEEPIGQMDIDHAKGKTLSLNVKLPYKKGTLRALAVDQAGNIIGEDIKKSFGDTASLNLSPDKYDLKADGQDLIFLEISALDKDNTEVANANNLVRVEVSGAGRLVGLDNGDSTDFSQYKTCDKRLFSGKLMAIIKAGLTLGKIFVKVSSPGLPDSETILNACEPDYINPDQAGYINPGQAGGTSPGQSGGTSPGQSGDIYENEALNMGISIVDGLIPPQETMPNDIPVRKIEFKVNNTVFSPEEATKEIAYTLYPENNTYSDQLTFKATTVLGIATNLAQIEKVEDGRVRVTCKGDGDFYLRATCKNGTDKNQVLTQIHLTGQGIGNATFNPYEFITGGLFNLEEGGVTTGVERGACFAKEPSYFGFKDVDFGMIGSDRVNIPIYHLGNDPVELRIYDGVPGQGGELIGKYSYWKPPIWATYQAEDFLLTKKLKGMHTIVFEADESFQIKGFCFYKNQKERAVISASDAISIYGDTFVMGSDEVTGIGNNVLLDFGEFDFGDVGPSRLIIEGRSRLTLNSIHVDFKGDVNIKKLCEFEGCENYEEKSFMLENIRGKVRVSFTFLPGSNFDFKSFRFEQ
ncbi:MAG: DUF4982 domain-containing protein [Eubacterium sp.]|nr:DUF4982 domain-containing protein [Eubacterium sp.]